MHYFFANEILGEKITFTDEEVRHLIKSLRIQEGDQVWVLDGKGGKYRGKIVIQGKQVWARVEESNLIPKPSPQLHLAIAPTKSPSRLEWLIEKATELGVDEITPMISSRSEKTRIKTNRLQKIAISALKQSGNPFLPRINPLRPFTEVIDQTLHQSSRFIAHCQTHGLPHLSDLWVSSQDTIVLIGPEGDFSLDEVEAAKLKGFTEISLGNLRLRTETAGIYVTTLHSILNKQVR